MIVHDGFHVGSCLVYLAVNEALQIHSSTFAVDRIAIEVVLHDVVSRDERRRQIAREKIAVRIAIVPNTNVPVAIDDSLVCQDMVRGY